MKSKRKPLRGVNATKKLQTDLEMTNQLIRDMHAKVGDEIAGLRDHLNHRCNEQGGEIAKLTDAMREQARRIDPLAKEFNDAARARKAELQAAAADEARKEKELWDYVCDFVCDFIQPSGMFDSVFLRTNNDGNPVGIHLIPLTESSDGAKNVDQTVEKLRTAFKHRLVLARTKFPDVAE